MRSPGRRPPVVVCCGPGGVGKTTVSATFALQAARAGRRACVVTVDPARRLADALGVDSLPNTPTGPGRLAGRAPRPHARHQGHVRRPRPSATPGPPEQAQAIQANRLYQNLAGALSGTQEYMAMEKLYELTETGAYDMVVVDTPPTRNALDLLDAPRRLTHFLENRLFRALLLPTRAYLRAWTGHPGAPADDLQGGRGRDRPGRGGLLPGLPGYGGGLPDPGRRRARAAGRSVHRLRPGHLAPARRGGRGRLLRRRLAETGVTRPRWSSTGSTRASAARSTPCPAAGRERAGAPWSTTWPSSTGVAEREEATYGDLVGEVAPGPGRPGAAPASATSTTWPAWARWPTTSSGPAPEASTRRSPGPADVG